MTSPQVGGPNATATSSISTRQSSALACSSPETCIGRGSPSILGGTVTDSPPVVGSFARELSGLGWITDVYVGGSLATGDYVPGVSDLDLVALADGPVGAARRRDVTTLHRALDASVGAGYDLGCVYVEESRLGDLDARHPTWTHGSMVDRTLSGIARAELVLHGYAVLGRPPRDVLPAMGPDGARTQPGPSSSATGRGPRGTRGGGSTRSCRTSGSQAMARGRYAMSTGELLTKTRAIEHAHAPDWLIDQMRARRRGEHVGSPRLPQRMDRMDGREKDRRASPPLTLCARPGVRRWTGGSFRCDDGGRTLSVQGLLRWAAKWRQQRSSRSTRPADAGEHDGADARSAITGGGGAQRTGPRTRRGACDALRVANERGICGRRGHAAAPRRLSSKALPMIAVSKFTTTWTSGALPSVGRLSKKSRKSG